MSGRDSLVTYTVKLLTHKNFCTTGAVFDQPLISLFSSFRYVAPASSLSVQPFLDFRNSAAKRTANSDLVYSERERRTPVWPSDFRV